MCSQQPQEIAVKIKLNLRVLHFSISGPKSKGRPSGPFLIGTFLSCPVGFLLCPKTRLKSRETRSRKMKIGFDLNISRPFSTLLLCVVARRFTSLYYDIGDDGSRAPKYVKKITVCSVNNAKNSIMSRPWQFSSAFCRKRVIYVIYSKRPQLILYIRKMH